MASPTRTCAFGSLNGSSKSRGTSSPMNIANPEAGTGRDLHLVRKDRRNERRDVGRVVAPACFASSETVARVFRDDMALFWGRWRWLSSATAAGKRALPGKSASSSAA